MSRLHFQAAFALAFLVTLAPMAQAQSSSDMSGMHHNMPGMSEEEMKNMGGMHDQMKETKKKGMHMKAKKKINMQNAPKATLSR